jgi:hypothetical protein
MVLNAVLTADFGRPEWIGGALNAAFDVMVLRGYHVAR